MARNFDPGIHDSSPSCNNMKVTYAFNYGNPGWGWKPSTCGTGSRFTDSGLTSGVLAPRALHLTELRREIDTLRWQLGLPAFAWTDETIVQRVTPVRVVHMTELRTALNQIYAAAGRNVPTYTDETLVPGITTIRSVHWLELQDAVLALDQ